MNICSKLTINLAILIMMTLAVATSAAAKTIVSPKQQVNLVEVYSSQGCSSCPPAERWLSQFKTDTRLFNQFIPINLHVDYWDYIGWKDPYALRAFTKRQQNYQRFGHTENIATPGFVVNGKGWNGWFYRQGVVINNDEIVGALSATISDQQVNIEFDAMQKLPRYVQAHIAILGFDQVTRVTRGENKGRDLPHDFVVIGYEQASIKVNNNNVSGLVALPDSDKFSSDKKAIVVWLSDRFDPKPIQAVGAWL